jgi:hypothetical protein
MKGFHLPKYRVVLEAIIPSYATIEVDAKDEDIALKKAMKLSKITDFKINEQTNSMPLRSNSISLIIA